MSIGFDGKPTYGDDDKYIKTKIKTYEDSIITNFYNKKGSKKKLSKNCLKLSKKIPEEKLSCKCLSVIMLDSVLYGYEKYHPQIFLEECKYEQKIKTTKYIDEDLKSVKIGDTDNDNGNDSEE